MIIYPETGEWEPIDPAPRLLDRMGKKPYLLGMVLPGWKTVNGHRGDG
jgi:hypothetical protein